MGALVFKECWAHRVLGGSKTWEIRGCATRKRGRILVVVGRFVVGPVCIVDCFRISRAEFDRNRERHQAPATLYERYKQPHAYALASPVRRSAPLRITRRKGQVTWVLV